MKIKQYDETHIEGVISLETNPFKNGEHVMAGDFGVQIAEDGRMWICIDGVAFIRFTPADRCGIFFSKLKAKWEESNENKNEK